jgi:hypothetical protein
MPAGRRGANPSGPHQARNVLLKASGKSGRGAIAKVADFGGSWVTGGAMAVAD